MWHVDKRETYIFPAHWNQIPLHTYIITVLVGNMVENLIVSPHQLRAEIDV